MLSRHQSRPRNPKEPPLCRSITPSIPLSSNSPSSRFSRAFKRFVISVLVSSTLKALERHRRDMVGMQRALGGMHVKINELRQCRYCTFPQWYQTLNHFCNTMKITKWKEQHQNSRSTYESSVEYVCDIGIWGQWWKFTNPDMLTKHQNTKTVYKKCWNSSGYCRWALLLPSIPQETGVNSISTGPFSPNLNSQEWSGFVFILLAWKIIAVGSLRSTLIYCQSATEGISCRWALVEAFYVCITTPSAVCRHS